MSAPRATSGLYAAVALGSLAGGVLRALASLAFDACCGSAFPWATLFVNLAGSLIIGLCASATGPGGPLRASAWQRHLVMVGFCGGFTTFSAFSLETLQLMQAGRPEMAALYIGASLPGWLLAVWLGHRFGRGLARQ